MSLSYFDLSAVNEFCAQGILGITGLQFKELRHDFALAEFRVTPALHQPSGIMNGGVSLLIAESVASVAANFVLKGKSRCVGIDLNASHLESLQSGDVRVEAKPCRVGRTLQVWEVKLFRDDGALCCVSRVSLLRVGASKGKHTKGRR